jgi:hypothetical protein
MIYKYADDLLHAIEVLLMEGKEFDVRREPTGGWDLAEYVDVSYLYAE